MQTAHLRVCLVPRVCQVLVALGVALGTGASTASLQSAPVLIAAYSFDEGAGSTVADASGNGHDGVLVNGAAWSPAGRSGGGLAFDGVDDLVTIAAAAAPNLTSGMTLQAWVYPSGRRWGAVLAKPADPSVRTRRESEAEPPYALYVRGRNDEGMFVLLTGSRTTQVKGDAESRAGWIHLAATSDAETARLYLNGQLVESRRVRGLLTPSAQPLRIGGDGTLNGFFAGVVDDVRIYGGVLTAAQIQADMETPVGGASDTQPPTVSVTSPASGATISGSVLLVANAADDDSVASVQFQVDGAPVGAADTSAPYEAAWNTTAAGNGTHTVTAVARDAAGNEATSAPVSISVFNDTTAPAVAVTSPAAGATVSGVVTIAATTTDDVSVASVQFLVDGVASGAADTVAPYEVEWTTTGVTNGTHTLAAIARDAAGNESTSDAVSVTVFNDMTAPDVAITSPAPGARVNGTVTIAATATDDGTIASVQFFIDGAAFGAPDTAAPYEVDWNTNGLTNAEHALVASARDAAGNEATSAAVTVIVFNDTTPPVVLVTAPAAGATVSGTVIVAARAEDDDRVASVQFLVDGVAFGAPDTEAPYEAGWDTTSAPNGPHTLAAVARDAGGNEATASAVGVTVFNDTAAPAVAITAPASGATLNGPVTLVASATDDGTLASVQFLVDGVAFGAADTMAPYEIPWDTTTSSNGAHTIAALARDAAGNEATSAGISVTVFNDTIAPAVTVTAPANGVTVKGAVTLSAHATDDGRVASVQFLVDGIAFGPAATAAPYELPWDTTAVANGPHTISALARDEAGNEATSAAIGVTVDNDTTPPAVAVTAPADGAALFGIVQLTADASDAGGIASVEFFRNGTAIAPADTTAPYALPWDTTSLSNGVYTISARALDAAGNAATTAVTVWVDNAPAPAPVVAIGFLNDHAVLGDESHGIVSWLAPQASAYDAATAIAWDFLLNRVPKDRNGLPAYLTNSYLNSGTLEPSGWMHNPAHLYAAVIESALAYYAYSGDARVIALARTMADYHLAHGRTPAAGWAWSGVPYASGCGGCTSYDGTGTEDTFRHIEPDKVGELGVSLIRLYRFTGDVRYRDAAIDFANALAARVRPGNATHSPWPFRVDAMTDAASEEYSANVIKPIALFDELIRLNLGTPTLYRAARAMALDWLLTYPMRNNQWSNYFEDVPIQATLWNWNQYIPMETAYYLMLHPEHDPEWRTHVPALIAWVEAEFGDPQFGANAIREQKIFHYVMGSHTSRYGAVNALYYELTGDVAAREKAYRALNWATYMISESPEGQIIDGPDVRNVWFTDGYGDYIRHFMRALGAVPEWAPRIGSRLTRFTSIVTSIAYGPGDIAYTTADAEGIEVLKVDFLPREVTVNGVQLPQRSDLSAPGWTFDTARGVLRIRHAGGASIRVTGRARSADATSPAVTITAPANGATVIGAVGITAEATDDTGVASVQFYVDGIALGGPDTLAPYAVTWNSVDVADGVHAITAVARDAAGNTTTSSVVSVIVDNPDERVITFDDAVHSQPLDGEYPTGIVDWGTGAWFLSGPFAQFTTNSISFNGASLTEASFTFLAPKRLLSVKASNGGAATTVTISCGTNPVVSAAVGPNELVEIVTGWTENCSTVTIASTNGWDTNFDDFVYDEAR